MFFPFFLQRGNAALGLESLQSQARIAIDLCNGVGDSCGFVLLFAEHPDFNQRGVARLANVDMALENQKRHIRSQRTFLFVSGRPLGVEVQIGDHGVEDRFGLNFLEFGLEEIRVIKTRRSIRTATNVLDVLRIFFHRDAHCAGIGFRQDERDERRRQRHQKKDRQDDRLANADNAPIIQKMQFDFRRVESRLFVGRRFHK